MSSMEWNVSWANDTSIFVAKSIHVTFRWKQISTQLGDGVTKYLGTCALFKDGNLQLFFYKKNCNHSYFGVKPNASKLDASMVDWRKWELLDIFNNKNTWLWIIKKTISQSAKALQLKKQTPLTSCKHMLLRDVWSQQPWI